MINKLYSSVCHIISCIADYKSAKVDFNSSLIKVTNSSDNSFV